MKSPADQRYKLNESCLSEGDKIFTAINMVEDIVTQNNQRLIILL